uniref:Uncharacterized protein n=1 Tax=Catharus ustulatus TaxID=91951 RepID=A0A8C3UGC0_CATUS
GDTKMLLSLGLLCAALSLGSCFPLQQASKRSKLLLVSFDGFRWDYDQDVDTPNLDTMAAEGVKAKYMTPAFVTLTSPCHFTLLTGDLQDQNNKNSTKCRSPSTSLPSNRTTDLRSETPCD